MIVLAILGTIGAVAGSVMAFVANGMLRGEGASYQLGWSIAVAWIISAVLWTAWWFN